MIKTIIAQEEYLKLDTSQSGFSSAASATCIAVRAKLKYTKIRAIYAP